MSMSEKEREFRRARATGGLAGEDAGVAGDGQSAESEHQGPREIGGPKGPEPTRYGDWEVKGRCSDF